MNLLDYSPNDFQNIDVKLIHTIPKSQILRLGISKFMDMLLDINYIYDEFYTHKPFTVEDKCTQDKMTRVHADFAGGIVRYVMGPTYDLVHSEFYKLPWSGITAFATMLSTGDIRSTMPKVDDKLYKKLFESPIWEPIVWTPMPQRLSQLEQMATYLEGKGV